MAKVIHGIQTQWYDEWCKRSCELDVFIGIGWLRVIRRSAVDRTKKRLQSRQRGFERPDQPFLQDSCILPVHDMHPYSFHQFRCYRKQSTPHRRQARCAQQTQPGFFCLPPNSAAKSHLIGTSCCSCVDVAGVVSHNLLDDAPVLEVSEGLSC